MESPHTLTRAISPPPRSVKPPRLHRDSQSQNTIKPTPADLEAGLISIDDHLTYFTTQFQRYSRATTLVVPRLVLSEFTELYQRNQHRDGRHFVIHQHHHPVAGLHYDLRIQFSHTSSLSFALPYGLPGDPNAKRRGRLAIETRVHCLWNHLIESASSATGSLLIWDTGEYTVLPGSSRRNEPTTDDDTAHDTASSDADNDSNNSEQENEKLIRAFQAGRIDLRLHGARLPRGYTVTMRLTSNKQLPPAQSTPRTRKRRRKPHLASVHDTTSSDDDISSPQSKPVTATASSASKTDLPTTGQLPRDNASMAYASDHDSTIEDIGIRASNAYPGSSNTIGSVHQRHWFLTLNAAHSGFVRSHAKGTMRWARPAGGEVDVAGGFEPFYVRGAEHERSVVTGRLSREVFEDEGIVGFRERKGWRGIE